MTKENSTETKTFTQHGTERAGSKLVPSTAGQLGTRISEVSDLIGSRKKAADVMGVSLAALQRYVRGENMPPLETAAKLCFAADVRIEWLVTGEPPMSAQGMTQPQRDTELIAAGDPDNPDVIAAQARRSQGIKEFTAMQLREPNPPPFGDSQPLRRDDMKIAIELAQEALAGRTLPAEKYAELVMLVYELLGEGLPRAKALHFAQALAA